MKKNYLTLVAAFLLLSFWACTESNVQNEEQPTEQPTTVSGLPAIDKLSKQIEENPNRASLYANRGAIWFENENFDEGIADLEKAIAMDSTKAEYYHVLADMYMDYYRSRLGLATMVKAGKLFPERIPTQLKLSEFQLILQQYNDALFTLEHIRKMDPQNAEMMFMFGRVFKEMNRKEEAIGAFQAAVENDPDIIDAWIHLAQLLSDKNSPIVEKYFDNAIRLDPNNIEALHAKAYYLSNKKNDIEGAISLYRQINTIDPQYVQGYYNIGLLYLDMDSLDRAYQSFDIAVKYAPQYPEAYYHRGVAAELLGDKGQAISDYKNVLSFDPEFAGAKAGIERLQ